MPALTGLCLQGETQGTRLGAPLQSQVGQGRQEEPGLVLALWGHSLVTERWTQIPGEQDADQKTQCLGFQGQQKSNTPLKASSGSQKGLATRLKSGDSLLRDTTGATEVF